MAKIAYLILAHENPKHLGRLIERLSSPSAACFVHVDKKSPAGAFTHVRGENVHFTRKRKAVHWGDYSIVEATVLLLRAALAYEPRLERFVLLSGADYPLRSTDYIDEFFDQHRDAEFMTLVPMPSEEQHKPLSWLTRYKPRPGSHNVNVLVRKALVRCGAIPRERDFRARLQDLVPYGGSTWWALSRRACEYILDFIEQKPEVVKFFKHTHCPDEMLFHTVLGNSEFQHRILPEVTYADWTAGGASPALISERHLDSFSPARRARSGVGEGSGEALFARKFSDESTEIAERLRELIEDGEPVAAERYGG